MKFQLVCDSAADLPASFTAANHITVVPFYVSLDGETYLKEGEELEIPAFYQSMIDHPNCFPKTSMPSIQDYMDAFLPLIQQGLPVLCICLTRAFSGSLQSALNAKMALEEDYPDAKIHVMDSQLVTALQGIFVREAMRLRDRDLTLEEAVPLLEEIRPTGRIFFTTKDLQYLRHGGRLGKVTCAAGSMLNLKPVLCFHDGALGSTEVAHGRKKSLQKVTDNFFHYLEEQHIDFSQYLFGTGVGAETPEYEEFLTMLRARFDETGIHPEEWVKIQIGATIGVHTGPYPVGLGILKRCAV